MTVTVDPHLVDVGTRAVADGAAESLSAWVNAALVDRLQREERLAALADAVAAFEEVDGPISDEEIAAQERRDLAVQCAGVGTGPRASSVSR